MNLYKIAERNGCGTPLLALIFASGVSMALVAARILWTGNVRYSFLGWNLFLAWIPLLLALAAIGHERAGQTGWRFTGLSVAWLLFFPNAPYILTDLIHLQGRFAHHYWTDLSLILSCAFTGLVLGFLSLYLMHGAVRRLLGSGPGWLFILGVAVLSGFGIYLGRILRFNSWDVIVRPVSLYQHLEQWAANPFSNSNTFAFPILFGIFLFVSYLVLYALTHLRHVPAPAEPRL